MTWQEIIIKLKDANVSTIKVNYDGSGDSGCITDAYFYDKHENFISDFHGLINEIESLVYPLLDGIEDWYNNDGGYGTITIELDTLSYTIDNHIRIVQEEVFEHEGTIKSLIE